MVLTVYATDSPLKGSNIAKLETFYLDWPVWLITNLKHFRFQLRISDLWNWMQICTLKSNILTKSLTNA